MTADERRRKMAHILDNHDRAAKELQDSSENIKAVIARSADLHEAIAKATTAMMAAHRAVVELYNDPD